MPSGADPAWLQRAEKASEFIAVADADLNLLYVNRQQPGVEDCIGHPVFEYFDPAQHDAMRQAIREARASLLPQYFSTEAVGPHGTTSTYSSWVIALPAESVMGEVTAFIATDTSEQGRVEAELELSRSTLQSLLQDSPDSILMVDRQHRILFINRDDLGFGLQQILGHPVASFVPEGDRDLVTQAVDEVLATGKQVSYETSVAGPAGTRHYRTRAVPVSSDGSVDQVMLVATDTTEQRAQEEAHRHLTAQLQQAQKMEALGQLTGGVAHDFNNLLTAIGGNLELARLGDNVETHIGHALEAVHRAAQLTQRLLAFSRNQPLHPRATDVGTLIEGMQQLLRRTLGESIHVDTEVGAGLWTCHVDPGQLENVILNLAVNSRDAMPDGGQLTIATQNLEVPAGDGSPTLPTGDYVRIAVCDTGTGMTHEVLDQAFEPFFTTKDVGLGSGLGLSMVYGFVRQSQGHLQIDTRPGEGCAVIILLPADRTATPEEPTTPAAAQTPVVRARGARILVVEDDPHVQATATAILSSHGFALVTARDAAEALELLAEHDDVSLVLTDIGLPGGMDGCELAQEIQRRHPELPVVLVSGYPEDEIQQRCGARGRTVLQKPYSADELATAVQHGLDASALR